MIDVVFVSFEGLPSTVSDSQFLIHIEDMRLRGVNIVLWIFSTKKKIHRDSVYRLNSIQLSHGTVVRLFRAIPVVVPFSELLNSIIFAFCMWQYGGNATIVHARTDYATLVCGLFKILSGYTLLLDRRGDALAEFTSKYSQRKTIRKVATPLQKLIISCRKSLANRLCDKAIFVSKELKAQSPKFDKPNEVIPCAASSKLFFFCDSLRTKTRNSLEILSSNRVIVFSGSLSAYQVFDKCVEMFNCMSQEDESLIFLTVTPYVDEAIKYLRHLPPAKFRLVSAPIQQVNSYLNAADFGLFMREFDHLNYVASPVKFAEYCMAGLPIIMTTAVEQSTSFSRILENGIYCDFASHPQKLEPLNSIERGGLSLRAHELLGRNSVANKYLRLYSA